jgi:hypothetical protein
MLTVDPLTASAGSPPAVIDEPLIAGLDPGDRWLTRATVIDFEGASRYGLTT